MLNMSNMATTDNNSLSPSPTPADKAVQIRKEEINKIALENLRDPDIKLKDWQIAAFLRKETRRKETQCDLYTHRIWKDNDLWSRTCASG